jgi:hypothetical protein
MGTVVSSPAGKPQGKPNGRIKNRISHRSFPLDADIHTLLPSMVEFKPRETKTVAFNLD